MKRFISYLLIFCFIICVFSACKKEKNNSEQNLTSSGETATTTEKTENESKTESAGSSKITGTSVSDKSSVSNSTSNAKPETENPNDNKTQNTTSSSGGNSSSKEESTTSKNEETAVKTLTYKEYISKTPAEQQAYFETFDSVAEFASWYNAAKAEYDANNSSVQLGGNGSIDLGDLIK